MRIFLLLLLLTLLPLQSPAAAAMACRDQTQVAEGLHNKHHQAAHGLAISMATSNEGSAVSSSSFELECGTCHSNCAAALFTISASFADPAGIERIEQLEATRVPPLHARPYRPQWPTPIRSGFDTAA